MRGFNGRTPNSAVFIGSSITKGERPGVTWAQALPNLIGIQKGFIPSRNAGVGSNQSTQMLARFESDVLAYGPSMVSIENGINDAFYEIPLLTYEANNVEMIRKAKIAGARVTIWVAILCQEEPLNSDIEPYRAISRDLAAEFNCDLFDTYADMAALSSGTQDSYFTEASGMGQHLSAAGLAWCADLVGTGAYENSFLAAA